MPSAKKHPQKKDIERLEFRVTKQQKAMIKKAADALGKSLTDFVITAAYEAAQKKILEERQMILSAKDTEILIKAILNPPKPSPKLVEAVKHYKKMIKTGKLIVID